MLWNNKQPDNYDCGCAGNTECDPIENVITNVTLAQSYTPFQLLCSIYEPELALKRGTAFPELDKPYIL